MVMSMDRRSVRMLLAGIPFGDGAVIPVICRSFFPAVQLHSLARLNAILPRKQSSDVRKGGRYDFGTRPMIAVLWWSREVYLHAKPYLEPRAAVESREISPCLFVHHGSSSGGCTPLL